MPVFVVKKCFYKILIFLFLIFLIFLIFLNDFNMLILKNNNNKECEGSLLWIMMTKVQTDQIQ